MVCVLAQGLGQPHLCQKEKGAIEKAVAPRAGLAQHSAQEGG